MPTPLCHTTEGHWLSVVAISVVRLLSCPISRVQTGRLRAVQGWIGKLGETCMLRVNDRDQVAQLLLVGVANKLESFIG